MPRQRRRHRRKARIEAGHAAVIAAIVVAVPLISWGTVTLVSSGGEPPPSAASTEDSTMTPPATESSEGTADEHSPGGTPSGEPTAAQADGDDAAAREALDACAAQLSAGQAVATEANTGVGHWSEHIQARTDLLEGRNTQAETKDIWKRTRLAGADDLERFDAVRSTYDRLSGCDDLSTAETPDSLRADVSACLDRAGRTVAAVTAAIAAISDWEEHLAAMAAHSDGHMTAEQAQDNWVEAWESAPTNINAFNEAHDELKQAPDCSGADS